LCFRRAEQAENSGAVHALTKPNRPTFGAFWFCRRAYSAPVVGEYADVQGSQPTAGRLCFRRAEQAENSGGGKRVDIPKRPVSAADNRGGRRVGNVGARLALVPNGARNASVT
jgi:hypothetical protein